VCAWPLRGDVRSDGGRATARCSASAPTEDEGAAASSSASAKATLPAGESSTAAPSCPPRLLAPPMLLGELVARLGPRQRELERVLAARRELLHDAPDRADAVPSRPEHARGGAEERLPLLVVVLALEALTLARELDRRARVGRALPRRGAFARRGRGPCGSDERCRRLVELLARDGERLHLVRARCGARGGRRGRGEPRGDLLDDDEDVAHPLDALAREVDQVRKRRGGRGGAGVRVDVADQGGDGRQERVVEGREVEGEGGRRAQGEVTWVGRGGGGGSGHRFWRASGESGRRCGCAVGGGRRRRPSLRAQVAHALRRPQRRRALLAAATRWRLDARRRSGRQREVDGHALLLGGDEEGPNARERLARDAQHLLRVLGVALVLPGRWTSWCGCRGLARLVDERGEGREDALARRGERGVLAQDGRVAREGRGCRQDGADGRDDTASACGRQFRVRRGAADRMSDRLSETGLTRLCSAGSAPCAVIGRRCRGG